MRILILGGSGTEGGKRLDRSKSFPALLEARLPAILGEEVEVSTRAFYVQSEGALEYFEKMLADCDADAVVIAISPMSFAMGYVSNRIARFLGRSAGEASERTFRTFDRHTRPGKPGPVRAINRQLHKVARKLIGPEGVISEGEARRRYTTVFDRLARLEATDVIAMGPVLHMGRVERAQPKMNDRITVFTEAMRQSAEKRRFRWIDRQALIPKNLSPEELLTDGIHGGAIAHELVADALVQEFMRLKPRTVGAANSR